MKIEHAKQLLVIIDAAIKEAEQKEIEHVYIMQRAQALDQNAREELVDAIKEFDG